MVADQTLRDDTSLANRQNRFREIKDGSYVSRRLAICTIACSVKMARAKSSISL
jgi:hypothetical protein